MNFKPYTNCYNHVNTIAPSLWVHGVYTPCSYYTNTDHAMGIFHGRTL